MRSRGLIVALALSACASRPPPPPAQPVVVVPSEKPQPPPQPEPPAQRPVIVVPSHRPIAQRVLQVRKLRAGRVYAHVIYAREVKAEDGRVGRWVEVKGNVHDYRDRDGEGRAVEDMNVAEVRADAIYADEIEADFIDADEVHARHLKFR